MLHKFILGQAVGYTPPRGQYAPPGIYVVTAKLPERDGEFEITSNIKVNCTNALRGKASFMRLGGDARQQRTVLRGAGRGLARYSVFRL